MRLVEEEDQLRLVRVADLGQFLEQLRQQPEQERRVEPRVHHQLVGRQHVDDAAAVAVVRMMSAIFSAGSPKKFVAALLLQHQQRALDRADRGLGDIAVLRGDLVGACSAMLTSSDCRSFRSSSSSPSSSAMRKAMLSTPSCASRQVHQPRQQQRPHLRDGGADRVALFAEQVPEDHRELVVEFVGVEPDRLGALRRGSPWARPSPRCPTGRPSRRRRTPARPASEKPSARICSVTVLPVPVAPVTRPCRLAYFSSSSSGFW